MAVPFLDLEAHHAPLRSEIMAAIGRVIDGSAFAGGKFVEKFEKEFSEFTGIEHTVAVGSGTDALWLALVANGIGPGDEVITVPLTFFATAEAISRTGARPVFVDICEKTHTLDPNELRKALTPKTKAILPVHLFGQMAAMPEILSFADRHGLVVIEDAAQAHGATQQNQPAGGLGHAGCYSFFPGKNLGALGEAGAVVTRDSLAAERMRMLRNHGQSIKHHHEEIGWNCRMDGIQAAVLSIKLRHLAANNALRQQHARDYGRALAGIPDLEIPVTAAGNVHSYHLYAVRVPDRDQFVSDLTKRGIGTAIHYPVPVHLQPSYSHLGHRPGAFPVAEKLAKQVVSLPMFPELTSAQIQEVVAAVRDARGAVPLPA